MVALKKLSITFLLIFTVLIIIYVPFITICCLEKRTGVRETRCDNCFAHNFSYIIFNEKLCRQITSKQIIDLFIIILTTDKNFQARDAIRNTWLTVSKNNTSNIRYVFLLGKSTNASETDQKSFMEEVNCYHDIIQEDFVDVYKNLTYKTMMGFKYAATFCSHARFVLKTDDDMYINIPHLVTYLNTSSKTLQNKITGSCSRTARPIRDSNSKWYASRKSYQEGLYPGFCSGTAYATSIKVIKDIYTISNSVPFFHLEDIYVSLCLHLIGGSVLHKPGFYIGTPELNACLYKSNKLLTAHRLTPDMLKNIWMAKCKNNSTNNNNIIINNTTIFINSHNKNNNSSSNNSSNSVHH